MKNLYKRLSNVDSVEIVKVIKVQSLLGEGTEYSPKHIITEYFSLEGERLARTTHENNPKDIHEWIDTKGGEQKTC